MTSPTEETPERLDADERRGRLIVSEHRARYLWAAQLAQGAKVLDAGCGTGYGVAIMEEAGAARVTGVDVSPEAVAQASASKSRAETELRQADLKELPFADGEFDLIVCFEVIEHVPDRDSILDELTRVLAADGVLCISTPNRDVYPPGNPFHMHEYTPEEFEAALGSRFVNVELHRQTAWLASALLSDDEVATDESDGPLAIRMIKMEPRAPGQETFTVALASPSPIREVPSLLTLGEPFEVRWWQRQIDEGEQRAEALAIRTRHQASRAEERSLDSARRLLEVEELLAQRSARMYALENEMELRGEELAGLREQLARAGSVIEGMKRSLSWRITAPLRAMKGRRS